MTVQEAIEILRDTPIDIRSTREDDIHTLYATALDMAIEALSCSAFPNRSEPKTAESGSVEKEIPEIKTDRTIGGMIYRQDAIDAVKRNTFRLTFAEEQNCEGHVAWSAEAVYSDVMEVELLDLPSAQPELIEKEAYIRGFEQGRTQGMIDEQGEKK